ncbi:MAG: hypothetical protein ACOX7C_10055 [Brevefilum sp.]|jgi:hypothetical protein
MQEVQQRIVYVPNAEIIYSEMGGYMVMVSIVKNDNSIELVFTSGSDELTCSFHAMVTGKILCSIPLYEALTIFKEGGVGSKEYNITDDDILGANDNPGDDPVV